MNRQSLLALSITILFTTLPNAQSHAQQGSAKMLLNKLKAELAGNSTAYPAAPVKVDDPNPYKNQDMSPPVTVLAEAEPIIDKATTTINNAPWRWNSSRRPKVAETQPKVLMGLAPIEKPKLDKEAKLHTVQTGDTMASIARVYGISESKLRALNGVFANRKAIAGQVLKVKGTPRSTTILQTSYQNAGAPSIPSLPMGTDGFEIYTIKSGDNPSRIAQKFNVSSKALMELNEISNPRLLKIGQKLRVPKQKLAAEPKFDSEGYDIYIVETGDSPWTIAQKFGVEYHALIGLNGINNPTGLNKGQKLKIPAKR